MSCIRRGIRATLRKCIERDIDEGLLLAAADADIVAGHMFAVAKRMSTFAKDGAGPDKLLGIVESKMICWPTLPQQHKDFCRLRHCIDLICRRK
jgi:hypothetical protein